MKGYKAFNTDLTCKGYQYELDKTNVFEGVPVLCKTGFHFCTKLEDIIKYYRNPNMRVFEIEASGVITEAEEDCSKRACSKIKLIEEIPLVQVAKGIESANFVYIWARDIGNRDIMVDRITEPELAYYWAKEIGNEDVMINRITESKWAYWWAMEIGNRDVMIDKITESYYAYLWARDIGNQDIMIDKITDSYSACKWVIDIGNRDVMIDKIVEPYYIDWWLDRWSEDKQYFTDKGLMK